MIISTALIQYDTIKNKQTKNPFYDRMSFPPYNDLMTSLFNSVL